MEHRHQQPGRLSMRLLILPLLGLVCLPLSSPAPLTGYLKIQDINGESTDPKHKDWINILSFGLGIENLSTDTATKAQHTPLTITKPLDKATPLLMTQLATGTPVTGEIILEEGRDNDPDFVPRATFKLRDAGVRSLHIENSGDVPMVEASIVYSYAEWHVRQVDPDGNITDRAVAYYDMLDGTSGEIRTAPRILQAASQDLTSGSSIDVDITVLDEDTPSDQLTVEVASDNPAIEIGPVRWMAPETLRITLHSSPTYAGQSTVRVSASDSSDTTTMSFSAYADDTGTPWGGFIDAYFSDEEQLDTAIAGPIADPDGDQLSTLMEFLFGTNPREFTPSEEQLTRTIRHITPPGGGDPVPVLEIEFLRRIDDPGIAMQLFGSPDGDTWTPLRSESGTSPLYEESTSTGTNPLYEMVTGTVTPPGGATAYFIRFVGNM